MPWTYDKVNNTWNAEYNDLGMTEANNLIEYGQPWVPFDPEYDALIYNNYQKTYLDNPVRVEISQEQIMEFGYGRGVQIEDFEAHSIIGKATTLSDGIHTKQDMIDDGLGVSDDFKVGSQLKNIFGGVSEGGLAAAYVHNTVQFNIGDKSQFIVKDGIVVEIKAELRAFDDNFDFKSDNVKDVTRASS